mmetsp:Transcript_100796/g.314225  ORF Transcript_100796/g.314225 Transcript_100796/m.314225 type:complete len:347 (-) Transcript_100796:56-1096(-)|eukprot:CAMPEP_0204605250 /NCGR_PEP_ID=MMETSP0661-20131031/58366_1 /ASSEMBLY_ACC=CAM_ASM_000606 /TAXON_ID=109239 /ORGANISM="Alexandrium margalefi, Strain AMGDE01CS-322" /LENGTH=346 /DNA_ID=CAMNT_0051616473 /DNA_START=60 /DNA_END=1100 /DNA_ORIENTATION=-
MAPSGPAPSGAGAGSSGRSVELLEEPPPQSPTGRSDHAFGEDGTPPPLAGTGPSASSRLTRRYIAEPFLVNAHIGIRRSEIEDLLALFWLPASIFVAAEAAALVGVRKSFFESMTEGAFDQGPRYGAVVEVHVWASATMWALGALQVFCERTRKHPESAWRHRRAGQAMLGLFFSVVLPTSLYLTVLQRIDYLSCAVGAVLLDTAFCTSYFLLRGWRVGRLRRTSKSLSLHGRLMQCGVVMSMSILPQRLLQLYLTAQLKSHHQLNYTFSILVTSILFVLFGHFFDGPRGGIWISCVGAENAEEAYGSARAGPLECWAWRLRWLAYMAVYRALRWFLATPVAGAER